MTLILYLFFTDAVFNGDLENIITPVHVQVLEQLLIESKYDKTETEFLIAGFGDGFSLGYAGPKSNIKKYSPNLRSDCGSKEILWEKMLKEVRLGRFAGPFEEPPFDNFIQSPVGLVPKGENDTRLIFHLSYPRGGDSVNSQTPPEPSSVKYPDFSEAVEMCTREGKGCYVAKSDMKSAFRNLPIKPEDWRWLVMKAQDPWDNRWKFFVDKCLPFGSSISCAHFQ